MKEQNTIAIVKFNGKKNVILLFYCILINTNLTVVIHQKEQYRVLFPTFFSSVAIF